MVPHLRRNRGGLSLSTLVVYVVVFSLIFIGIPTFIVSHRLWPTRRESSKFSIRLLREDLGQVVEMDLEEYLVGVVAGEMPADFHMEALKAQAVAARTYALYRLANQSATGSDADLSSDFRSGQAWVSPEAQRERWGWYSYFQKRWRIVSAIETTRGEVLTYGGKPIFAAYHSTSGGATQDAGAYFNDVPYLRGVLSPGEESSPYYQTTKKVAWQAIIENLRLEIPSELAELLDDDAVNLTEDFVLYEPKTLGELPGQEAAELIHLARITETYPTGRVKAMEILGVSFSGREIREKLGLRSNWFTIQVDGAGVVFHIRGNGHGVGMSQYGAHGMALAGAAYGDILHHYYTDIEIDHWY